MKTHPSIGELPECQYCSAREWHECDVFRDDHWTLTVFNCRFCGSYGSVRDQEDSAGVVFRGAFMR